MAFSAGCVLFPPNDPVVALIVANVITIVLEVVEGGSLVTILVIYSVQCLNSGVFTGITILPYPDEGTGHTDPQVPSSPQRRARSNPSRYSRRTLNTAFACILAIASGLPLLFFGDSILY